MTVWNERFDTPDYVYGTRPNSWFKQIIDSLPAGRILIPGAGEGRDAVYAATLGWDVDAYDLSEVGKKKALRLAEKQGVTINYDIGDVANFDFDARKYDMVVMVYLHLHPEVRKKLLGNIYRALAPNGIVVMEAFHPLQIPLTSGGPKNPDMLITTEILSDELKNIEPIQNYRELVILNEGKSHSGEAQVVRFLGRLTK